MKAREYVQSKLPGAYVFSPCAGRFVVKHGGIEVAPRAKSKISAWVEAKNKLAAAVHVVDRKSLASGEE